MTKTIGILTSGGDCAGLNATIRAVALRSHHVYGCMPVGISHGTLRLLISPSPRAADPARLDAALHAGRHVLGSTNRDPSLPDAERRAETDRRNARGLRELHLDGLIMSAAAAVSTFCAACWRDRWPSSACRKPSTTTSAAPSAPSAVPAVAIATGRRRPAAADRRQPRPRHGAR